MLRSRLAFCVLSSMIICAIHARAQVPPNDDCANAIAVVNGANGPFNNLNATSTVPWPCAQGDADVWFTYTASCSGPISFTTCGAGTNYDTAMEVFTGTCAALSSIACNDDSCGQQSTIVINATQGTAYIIRVGGYAGRTGTFMLDIACTSLPANDECSGAVAVVDGINGPFTNTQATDSLPAWPCEPTAGSDIWYTYTATCSGPVSFDTCSVNTDFDTVVEVFDGSCGALNSIACDDDTCGISSSALITATAGTQYFVRVGGWAQRQGNFDLTVTCTSIPSNDECANAIAIVTGTNGPFTNTNASTSMPVWSCGEGGADVWFRYDATCDATLTADTCSAATNFDTTLEVLDGACANLGVQGCNDDTCIRQSSVTFQAMAGTTYYIRVGGWRGRQGDFELNLSQTGTGSLSSQPTGCGTVTLTANGSPNIGGTVTFALTNVAGSPMMWIGQPLGVPLCPPATCVLGATFDVLFIGSVLQGTLPCNPSLIGGSFAVQGADIGGTGGCAAGTIALVPLSVTDTWTVVVGQ